MQMTPSRRCQCRAILLKAHGRLNDVELRQFAGHRAGIALNEFADTDRNLRRRPWVISKREWSIDLMDLASEVGDG